MNHALKKLIGVEYMRLRSEIKELQDEVEVTIKATNEELESIICSLDVVINRIPLNDHKHILNLSILLGALQGK